MKTLYHGSYMEVSQPLAKAGRRNLDLSYALESEEE